MFILQAAATRTQGGIETAMRHYHRMGASSGASTAALYRGPIAAALRSDGLDIITFHSLATLGACSLLRSRCSLWHQINERAKNQTIAAIIHSDLILPSVQRLFPEAITVAVCHSDKVSRKSNADIILTLNDRQHEIARRSFPHKAGSIHLVGNPFIQQPSYASSTEKNLKPQRIVFCARFVDLKNPIELLRAYQLIDGSKPPLVFYGDGPLLSAAKDYASANLILATFAGWVSDPWAAIGPNDILVVTSKWEGLPFLLQEALSRGIPIVASNIAGNSAALDAGAFGDLYELGNVQNLAETLQSAIREPSRLQRRAQLGGTKITKRYGSDAFYVTLSELVGKAHAERRAV